MNGKNTEKVPTFVIKAINPVYTCAFVITAEDEEVFGVLDLVSQEEADGLQRLLATVHVVPKKEVICLRREATILE